MIVGQIRIAPVVSEDVFDPSAAALAFAATRMMSPGGDSVGGEGGTTGEMEYEEGFREGFLRENMVSECVEVDTAVRIPVKMMTAEKVFP